MPEKTEATQLLQSVEPGSASGASLWQQLLRHGQTIVACLMFMVVSAAMSLVNKKVRAPNPVALSSLVL